MISVKGRTTAAGRQRRAQPSSQHHAEFRRPSRVLLAAVIGAFGERGTEGFPHVHHRQANFPTATVFTAAQLGAEGVRHGATVVIGNGYVPGHAELTLDLLRRDRAVRELFEREYAR